MRYDAVDCADAGTRATLAGRAAAAADGASADRLRAGMGRVDGPPRMGDGLCNTDIKSCFLPDSVRVVVDCSDRPGVGTRVDPVPRRRFDMGTPVLPSVGTTDDATAGANAATGGDAAEPGSGDSADSWRGVTTGVTCADTGPICT